MEGYSVVLSLNQNIKSRNEKLWEELILIIIVFHQVSSYLFKPVSNFFLLNNSFGFYSPWMSITIYIGEVDFTGNKKKILLDDL